MTGRWYEYTKDWTMPFQMGMRCTTVSYADEGSGVMSVTNKGYFWPLGSAMPITINGQAKCSDANAACSLSYDTPFNTDIDPNYNVLATDYTGWAVIYACNTILWGELQWDELYVLSRTPDLTDAQYQEVEAAIAA